MEVWKVTGRMDIHGSMEGDWEDGYIDGSMEGDWQDGYTWKYGR